jgi:hypothetical protein
LFGVNAMAVYLSTNSIRIQAFEMARSGVFIDCQSIEAELEKTGFRNARAALRDRVTRSHINQLCAQNWPNEDARLRRKVHGRTTGRAREGSPWGA